MTCGLTLQDAGVPRLGSVSRTPQHLLICCCDEDFNEAIMFWSLRMIDPQQRHSLWIRSEVCGSTCLGCRSSITGRTRRLPGRFGVERDHIKIDVSARLGSARRSPLVPTESKQDYLTVPSWNLLLCSHLCLTAGPSSSSSSSSSSFHPPPPPARSSAL